MNQDFRTYLDRVMPGNNTKRGANITISHPKVPAVRWHEEMKGCKNIDDLTSEDKKAPKMSDVLMGDLTWEGKEV